MMKTILWLNHKHSHNAVFDIQGPKVMSNMRIYFPEYSIDDVLKRLYAWLCLECFK